MSDIELLSIDIGALESAIDSLNRYIGELSNEEGSLEYIKNTAPTFWNEGATEDINSYCIELGKNINSVDALIQNLQGYISTLRTLITEINEARKRKYAGEV